LITPRSSDRIRRFVIALPSVATSAAARQQPYRERFSAMALPRHRAAPCPSAWSSCRAREPETWVFGKKKFWRAGLCQPCQRVFCGGLRCEATWSAIWSRSFFGGRCRVPGVFPPQSRHGVVLENATGGRRVDAAISKGGPSTYHAMKPPPGGPARVLGSHQKRKLGWVAGAIGSASEGEPLT